MQRDAVVKKNEPLEAEEETDAEPTEERAGLIVDGHLQNVLQTASGDWFTRSMRVCYLPGKARMADTDPGLRLFLDSFFSFSLHG